MHWWSWWEALGDQCGLIYLWHYVIQVQCTWIFVVNCAYMGKLSTYQCESCEHIYSIFWEVTLLLQAKLMMLGVRSVLLVNTFSTCVRKKINVMYCFDIVWGIMGFVLTRVWKLQSKMPHQKIIPNIIMEYNTPKMCIIHRPINLKFKKFNFQPVIPYGYPQDIMMIFLDWKGQCISRNRISSILLHFEKRNAFRTTRAVHYPETECPPYYYILKHGMTSLQQYKGIPFFRIHCSHITYSKGRHGRFLWSFFHPSIHPIIHQVHPSIHPSTSSDPSLYLCRSSQDLKFL